ncbi:sulfotransferase [Granulosicoccus antarcticus]|uniref:Sulfotransferase domain-containing protein n=1 Tax=Granulosicoccus antarcticus IMCC3135 TaxID=1192854 RepID=A0A2Z2NI31_9GAMM|nr:sulfotransferase [Granulosicoccus antarcticus]ASJ70713.1 hypothetical protein IMCC3135_03000 [Granulosicoccus antarcticus IMCC3135]
MNLLAVVALFGLIGILFYELFVRLNVISDIQKVFNVAPAAIKVIRSTTLSDEEKEVSVRRMSLQVLKDTFTFTAKLAGVLLTCVAVAAMAQSLFTLSPGGLSDLLASWQGLIAAVVSVALYTRFKPVGEPASSHSSTSQYSSLDRLLHRIAFIHPGLQKILGDVENDLFKKHLTDVEVRRPVFVTGLPRAGTTLLLELLYDTDQFASFTYRQMPFVLNPLLWNRLSSGSRKQGEGQERAHGDGMLISYDSPEAFEEVLWVSYQGKSMFDDGGMRTLMPTDLDANMPDAFVNLARKLVCLKELNVQGAHPSTPSASDSDTQHLNSSSRYLSKNNANLSRLDAIRSVFSDADLLLCYRHPTTHVASLHTQHLRFLEIHKNDAFARNYMRWIGHHDFGANFRPIHFSEKNSLDPTQRLFWLQYWVDAYRHVLEHAPEGTQFIGYESLLQNGSADLGQLAKNLELNEVATTTLMAAAKRLRAPGSLAEPLSDLSTNLALEAEAIYSQLSARSVAQGYTGYQKSDSPRLQETGFVHNT